jgi:hypothetical protein
MTKIKEDKQDIADFFRQEILNTRILVDNVRRNNLVEHISLLRLQNKDKFLTKKEKS